MRPLTSDLRPLTSGAKPDPYATPVHKRIDAILIAITIAIIVLIASSSARAQTVYDWHTTGSASAWLTAGNWSIAGSTATTFPGVDNSAGTTTDGSTTDIAAFGATANTTGAAVGINFSTAGGGLTLATLDLTSAANRQISIGNSSTVGSTTATLTLNGSTLNSTANTIIANESAQNFVIREFNGGASPGTPMTLALGNATDNVIQINSTGGITISTAITGAGKNLTLTGTGSGAGAVLTLSGTAANTYSGTTTVNARELDLSKTAGVDAIAGNLVIGDGTGGAGADIVKLLASDQINNSSDVTINSSGLFNLNSNSETIDGLSSSSSTASVTLGTGTLTVGGNNQATATFAGVISGTGGNLQKNGTGTQTLTGNNTYTGTTTINGGTLEINNTNSTSSGRISGTSGVTVNSGGTLLLSGSNAFTDRINTSAGVTISGGGKFSTGGLSEGTRPSSAVASDGVAGMGALTLTSTSSGSRATIDFATGANGSSLVFSSLSGGSGAFLDILNWTGTIRTDNGATGNDRLLFATNPSLTEANLANYRFFDDAGTLIATGATIIAYGNEFELVPVPEPSTWIGAALAVAAIGFTQRRRLRRLIPVRA